MPKEHVALIYTLAEHERTPDRRLSSCVAKQVTEVLVLLAGLRVRGLAHAVGQLDSARFHHLVTERQGFIAVTAASLALDIEGTTARDIGVAFINIRHIQFLARLEPIAGDADPRQLALAGVRS